MVTYKGVDETIRTVCGFECGGACGIAAHVKDGVLIKVEPGEFPDPKYRHMCPKALCSPKWVYHPDRLKYPLKRVGERGEVKWQRISWDEAFDTIVARFMEITERYGSRSIAWLHHRWGCSSIALAIGRLASAMGNTVAIDLGPGDAAHVCANIVTYGQWVSPLHYTTYDFENMGLCVLWGINAAVTQGFAYKRIRFAQEQGTKVIVIDPRFTATAAKADEHIPIRPGTDAALALGMIDVIIKQGLQDESLISNHTVGPLLVRNDNGQFLKVKDFQPGGLEDSYIIWDTKTNSSQNHDKLGVSPTLRGSYNIEGIECKPAFELLAQLAAQYPLEKTSEITEVAPDTIRRLAIDYATRKPAASIRGMGNQRTFHGDLSHRAITALAAITGNIHTEGHPDLESLLAPVVMPEGKIFTLLSTFDVFKAALTDKPYPVKALWVTAANTVNQHPNFNKTVNEYLPHLEFIVVTELFMTPTAEYADIVLPGCTFFEHTQLVAPLPIFSHSYLQLQQQVIEPLYESKSEFYMVTELAKRMGLGQHFDKSEEELEEELIERLTSSSHPFVKDLTLERLKQGPVEIFYQNDVCNTPTGRIEFYSERLREFGEELPVYKEPVESARQTLAKEYPLSFLQAHPRMREHSQFADIGWVKELYPEPVIEMNPLDADNRGIKDGDMVIAFNDRGSVKVKARVHEGIRPGIVNIEEGWWPKHFAEGTLQALTHDVINPAQQAVFTSPNIAFYDVLVEVKKAKEE